MRITLNIWHVIALTWSNMLLYFEKSPDTVKKEDGTPEYLTSEGWFYESKRARTGCTSITSSDALLQQKQMWEDVWDVGSLEPYARGSQNLWTTCSHFSNGLTTIPKATCRHVVAQACMWQGVYSPSAHKHALTQQSKPDEQVPHRHSSAVGCSHDGEGGGPGWKVAS